MRETPIERADSAGQRAGLARGGRGSPRGRRGRAGLVGALVLLSVAIGGGAHADEKAAAALETLNQKASTYEVQDERRQVTHEIGTLRTWLGEANAYARGGDTQALRRAVNRANAQARLIEALLARAGAEEAARIAHETADTREREATAARAKATELEKKLTEMEKQFQAQGGAQ